MFIERSLASVGAILLNCLFGAALAQPPSITCYFTEPFVRTVISLHRHTLTVNFDVKKRKKVERGLSLQVTSPTGLQLKNKAGEVIQELLLSHRGSDGMSDQVYPYEVRWTPRNEELPQALYGGCR
jgi:uncharacterized membrane protein